MGWREGGKHIPSPPVLPSGTMGQVTATHIYLHLRPGAPNAIAMHRHKSSPFPSKSQDKNSEYIIFDPVTAPIRPYPNRHHSKISTTSPNATNGPYCLTNNSQLILTAARLYFRLSSLNRLLISPIRSRLSPRYNRSSIFFVMTLATSFNSSLRRLRLPEVGLAAAGDW